MRNVYHVQLRRPRRRRAWALLLIGALLLYGASFWGKGASRPSVRSAAGPTGVRVTREEELAPVALYALVFTETTNALRARVEAARYAPRGAAGYVWESGGLFRTIAALYPEEEEAQRAAENLLRGAGIDCAALEVRAPGALLRVTATEEQTEALLAADAALPEAIARLGAIAQAIDDGETDAARALSDLATEAARLTEAREALRQADFRGGEAVPKGLAALLESAAEELRALAQERDLARLALSSRTRCCQAGLAQRFCRYRAGLAG